MPKISIIIPVFNAEKYIEKCLLSVINQTIKNMEIICIDDESTDFSIGIIKEYIRKDNRIKLLYQTHQGAGEARNKGIENATGEYIAFLDADDYYYDSDALEKMVQKCEQNKVNACGSFSKKYLNGEVTEYNFWGENKGLLDSEILNYNCFQMDYGFTTFVYRRKMLVSNNIFFPSYLRFEDPVFIVKALHKIESFSMVNSFLYCCRISVSVSKYTSKVIKDVLKGIQDNLYYAYNNQLDILFENTVKRLEYELNSYILHNVKVNDLSILERLMSINNLIRIYFHDEIYIIRPLRQMLHAIVDTSKNYERYLKNLVLKNDNIIVYGAGKYGKVILNYLRDINQICKVQFIMISEVLENELQINHIPVISIQNIDKQKWGNSLVLIAVSGISQKDIITNLKNNGYMNYEVLDNVFLSDIDEQQSSNLLVQRDNTI